MLAVWAAAIVAKTVAMVIGMRTRLCLVVGNVASACAEVIVVAGMYGRAGFVESLS